MRKVRLSLAVALGLCACSASSTLLAGPDSGIDPIPDSGPVPDSGVDAGPDAGVDGGPDAGPDAGPDGGTPSDGGVDAGPTTYPDSGFVFSDAGLLTGDGGVVTRYPIILAHGFGVFANSTGQTFHAVLGALQDSGVAAFDDDTDPFNSTAAEAAQLLTTIEQVTANTGAPAVNIIAHSMGGLNARYVASPGQLGRGDLIASITTISTPHQGSAMADFTLQEVALLGPAASLVPGVAALISALGIPDLGDPNVIACLTDLSVAAAPAFNAATTNDPRVMYQSWAGFATVGGAADANIAPTCGNEFFASPTDIKPVEALVVPLAAIVAGTLQGQDNVNDSIVPIASGRWGTFRGCIPEDHFGEAGGTVNGDLADPDPDTGFDYVAYYFDIVRDLAARGY